MADLENLYEDATGVEYSDVATTETETDSAEIPGDPDMWDELR